MIFMMPMPPTSKDKDATLAKNGQNLAGRKLSLYYVFQAADVEVVGFRWIEMVALTQQSHNLLGGLGHGFAGDSRAEDVVEPECSSNPFLHCREGHHNKVVLILSGR